MGAYMGGLASDSEEIHRSTDPPSPDWITIHAKATGSHRHNYK